MIISCLFWLTILSSIDKLICHSRLAKCIKKTRLGGINFSNLLPHIAHTVNLCYSKGNLEISVLSG